ncbi:MAG: histidine phosphatase family protein [Gammaproteobacteria bacterium]|nr:histidine phosphatase family protein [Gammaproteobacteria bacterium]
MNHLSNYAELSNDYYVMRHGHSLANQQGLIVSHPVNGCAGFGLNERGREQVRESLQQDKLLDADTIIISSDFRRALESAGIAHAMLDCRSPLESDERLRERCFGDFELGPDSAYDEVWQQDELDPDGAYRAVECVNHVMARVTALIVDCEQRYAQRSLLLVSHGDALQILQTAFALRDASAHRQLVHLQTAEIRRLLLS